MNESVMELPTAPLAPSCPSPLIKQAIRDALTTALLTLANRAGKMEDIVNSALYDGMPDLASAMRSKIEGINVALSIVARQIEELTASP